MYTCAHTYKAVFFFLNLVTSVLFILATTVYIICAKVVDAFFFTLDAFHIHRSVARRIRPNSLVGPNFLPLEGSRLTFNLLLSTQNHPFFQTITTGYSIREIWFFHYFLWKEFVNLIVG